MKVVSLSHNIKKDTPLYGSYGEVKVYKTSEIKGGDTSNNTHLEISLHTGTHIDFPYHFFENGQTYEDFKPEFWIYKKPLVISITPDNKVVNQEVVEKIEQLDYSDFDILIIDTNSNLIRQKEEFIFNGVGLHSSLADVIREKLPNVRTIILDTISVASYSNRSEGRNAHREFLDPNEPILIVEDANLEYIKNINIIEEIIISPLPISKTDGAPCNILAKVS